MPLLWRGGEALTSRTKRRKTLSHRNTSKRPQYFLSHCPVYSRELLYFGWTGQIDHMMKKNLFKWVQPIASTGGLYRCNHYSRKCCGPKEAGVMGSTPWRKFKHTLTKKHKETSICGTHMGTTRSDRELLREWNANAWSGQKGKDNCTQEKEETSQTSQWMVYRDVPGRTEAGGEVSWSFKKGVTVRD